MKLLCIICTFVSLLLLTKGALSDSAYDMRRSVKDDMQCFLIISTAKSVSGAHQIIANIDDQRFMEVFETNTGMYAVSIGTLRPDQVGSVVTSWKASGRIPKDAYCADVEQFKRPLSGFKDYGDYPDFSFAPPDLSTKELKVFDDLDRQNPKNAEEESVFNEILWKKKSST